jgi:sarcosine oxidase subunit gamma
MLMGAVLMVNDSTKTQTNLGVSPLDGIVNISGGPQDAGIWLQESRHVGKLILRGSPGDNNFITETNEVLGQKLPIIPNTFVRKNDQTIVWLGPDEWLITCTPGNEKSLEADLISSLSIIHNSVTNVSDNSTIIKLSGPAARTVLMKGCAIDIHPRVFVPGSAVQSNLAAAFVTFWQLDLEPTYNILVRASFSTYLWNWLLDAGAEFGIHIQS